ncbi:sigma-54 interaction domain-containing protein [Bdellovibrio svalbardensis]|uniref:Sigma-54 dependent transcriptional regulator n=1 Tax=Bdellovibrio svalbardensis TaxID=2972972 RepID=A0ABT6DFQ8_9BACT|nr:sigma-54 dependent transcriptional regulator [Bdellovibrio svalbardensis]MDG0815685.1 sigma-54 dependent transcriptional regulator [Bdellovibrio svalbardensis]
MLNHKEVIAKSPAFIEAVELAKRVAESSANVLILGESGSGKEVIAQMIHDLSKRKSRAFIPLNCSAIPENLLESELFGYAKGAFTGAGISRMGLFEEAEGGTLFLDEIGDLDLNLQAKLLRVIQERKIKRVGENTYRPINIRIICATHENLQEAIKRKSFREDLYFRLNVISIEVPPLRQRHEDIMPLAYHFLRRYSSANGKVLSSFSADAIESLMSHSWPGNVRELENLIERAVVLCSTHVIQREDLRLLKSSSEVASVLPSTFESLQQFLVDKNPYKKILPIEEITQQYIQYALEINRGAKDKTARDLGIDRKTLYRRLRSSEDRS